MKPILLCLFSIVFFQLGFGQTSIEGYVQVNGARVANANLKLLSPIDSSILVYTRSDIQGNFKLKVKSNLPEFLLLCQHMNHGQFQKIIQNQNQQLQIELNDQAIVIPEVTVEAPALKISGDTLTYLMEAFASKKDRTLADVLKNIPGLEVNSNGTIRYQGQPLIKFYVEGKDLMDHKYGIINNAMPYLDVQSIEILRNHQPIKMLEETNPSYQTALNVKLKNNISFTGRSNVGIGGKPLIWNLQSTPMLFSKKNQTVFDLKLNNNGEDLISVYESTQIGTGLIGDITRPIRKVELLRTSTAQLPELPSNTYLDNRTMLLSANSLLDLSKQWGIKFQLETWKDQQLNKATQSSSFLVSNQSQQSPLTYQETIQNSTNNKHLATNIQLNQNSKRNYLKNHFTFQTEQVIKENLGILNSEQLDEAITSPNVAIQNSLAGIYALGAKKQHVYYSSFIQYLNNRHQYSMQSDKPIAIPSTGMSGTNLLQTLNHNQLESLQKLSMNFFIKNWQLKPEVALTSKNEKLYSLFQEESPLKIINNSHVKQQQISLALSSNFQYKKINITFHTPFNINWVAIHTEAYNLNENKLFFEPSFNLNWAYNPFWTYEMQAYQRQQFGNIDHIHNQPILNATSFIVNPPDLSRQHNRLLLQTFKYNNPLHGFQGQVSYTLRSLVKKFLYDMRLDENGIRSFKFVPQDNQQSFHILNGLFSKYFHPQRLNISLKGNYMTSVSNSMIQSILQENRLKQVLIGTRIIYKKLDWLGTEAEISWNNSTLHNRGGKQEFKTLNWNLNLYIIPFDKHLFDLNLAISRFDYSQKSNDYPFLDLMYRFSIEKKKLDFEIKWTNLLQVNSFERLYFNQAQIIQSEFRLRRSQVMMNIKFNFR